MQEREKRKKKCVKHKKALLQKDLKHSGRSYAFLSVKRNCLPCNREREKRKKKCVKNKKAQLEKSC